MPIYLVRAYDLDGSLIAEDEFNCSDDEFEAELADCINQPAYFEHNLIQVYELKPKRVFRNDENT